MSDLISRSALLAEIDNERSLITTRTLVARGLVAGMQVAKELTTEAPAVDAVEVVRCKDCFYNDNGCCTHSENYDDTHYRADYFCADGLRRADYGKVRLIDANALLKKRFSMYTGFQGTVPVVAVKNIDNAITIDPESLRPKGRWDWKHRHKGGFHKYTGVDEYGETHTITVDERVECDEPYCPNCGKWNESIYLNYCPNCGAKMEG